jgi:hypothetical protein
MVASAAAVLLGLGIASVNGANDVSKGIATLVGTGVADARRAILWGTLWTGAGAVSAAFVATAMVQTFGKGLLSSGVDPTLSAGFSAIAGAALWVLLATVRGPASIDHPRNHRLDHRRGVACIRRGGSSLVGARGEGCASPASQSCRCRALDCCGDPRMDCLGTARPNNAFVPRHSSQL